MDTVDLVISGAPVLTIDPARPRAEAVAIRAGTIVAVGDRDDVAVFRGPHTRELTLDGGAVLPGFQDAHNHACFAGRYRLTCDLHDLHTRQEYLDAVAAYAAANPDAEWIVGGGWGMPAFPGGLPRAEDLDGVVADRPVYLMNSDLHGAWVNSRALELAGIDRRTPDPPGGRIERDPDGAPTGALHEWARDLVAALLPPTADATWRAAILASQRHLLSLGVTAWQDAWVEPDVLAAYRALAASGELRAHVVACQWWDRTRGTDQIPGMIERRGASSVGTLRAGTVKIMQDGVPENFTAAVVEPYLEIDGAGGGTGFSFNEPAALREAIVALDAEHFQVHVHTIGDRAIRETLDAFEAAAGSNGARDARHHLTHLQLLDPADVSRFRALDLVATVQPYWASADEQMTELTIPFLGHERSGRQYAFRSLHDAGVRLAFASDWAITTADPLMGIEVAVTRTDPEDRGGEPFLPQEALDLGTALAAATIGSAYVNRLDATTGSIVVGKDADLVVLDHDPTDPDLAGPADARVELTMIGGEVVYERGARQ
ncbi:MAG TPA: amidohydrolase [Actinomycetota bacterium]|nr:amidohydrolase [Actinomycetota bacterium]